jgi:hypothetical protein
MALFKEKRALNARQKNRYQAKRSLFGKDSRAFTGLSVEHASSGLKQAMPQGSFLPQLADKPLKA